MHSTTVPRIFRGMLAAVLVLAVTVPTEAVQKLDLEACIRIAKEKDRSLIAAEKAVRKAEAALMKARSAYFPQVTVQSRYVRLDDPYHLENFTMKADMGTGSFVPFTVERFEFSDDEMVVTEAAVELPLFTWWRITNMNRLAKEGVRIAEAKRKAVQDQILYDVVTSYKQAVLAREARRILLETISEMELFYKTARKDFKRGARNAPEKDVIQIGYDLDDMKTWLPELNKWENLSIEALKVSMGMDAATPLDIVGDTLEYPDLRKDLGGMVEKALANRPEIAMLEHAVRSARLQKKMAAVSNLPMIGAFAKTTWTSDDFDPNQDSISAVGVGATMHLFDGLKGYAEYKEASYQAVMLENQLDYLKRRITLQVTQAVTELDEFYEQLKIREAARKKAIRQVKVVRQGYQYGITTVDDVNDAQVQKRWSDAHWLFKKLDYIKAIANLNRVVGEEVFPLR